MVVKYGQFCANDPFSNSGLDVKSLFQESVGFGNDEILALLYNLIGPEVSKPKSTHILEQKISYTLWSQLLGERFSEEHEKKNFTLNHLHSTDLPR